MCTGRRGRRIYRDYAEGRSLLSIAHALNKERVPFPTALTMRGPVRKGWSNVTVLPILRTSATWAVSCGTDASS
jgi:hypothetical protein